MNIKSRRRRSSAVLLLLAVLATILLRGAPSTEGQTTNGVFLPGSTPYGKTYEQWSAGWWQWNFSAPTKPKSRRLLAQDRIRATNFTEVTCTEALNFWSPGLAEEVSLTPEGRNKQP
jgi:hypothetical protein